MLALRKVWIGSCEQISPMWNWWNFTSTPNVRQCGQHCLDGIPVIAYCLHWRHFSLHVWQLSRQYCPWWEPWDRALRKVFCSTSVQKGLVCNFFELIEMILLYKNITCIDLIFVWSLRGTWCNLLIGMSTVQMLVRLLSIYTLCCTSRTAYYSRKQVCVLKRSYCCHMCVVLHSMGVWMCIIIHNVNNLP